MSLLNGTMDSLSFDNSFTGKNLNSQCLVCGSLSVGNYVDLSLSSSRTSQSDTLIQSKLHAILLNSWILSDDEELILCIPCFHLVDQFDTLESQLDAVRKDLTDKYTSKKGIRTEVSGKQHTGTALVTVKRIESELKQKRRPYGKRKKQVLEETIKYRPITTDSSILEQELEHSLSVSSNLPEIHSMNTELPWSQDSVQLQQLGDISVTNSCWKKSDPSQNVLLQKHTQNQVECSANTPLTIYDDDPNLVNTGEKLRIGTEISDQRGISFACVYCNQIVLNIEFLKTHVHMHHCPKVITTLIPVELGLGSVMNCGIQLENVNNVANDSVKPFACIFCDGSFKFKSNLSLHFKEKHTPNKPFTCVECLESFRRSMELSRHKVYYCPHRKKNLPRKNKKVK